MVARRGRRGSGRGRSTSSKTKKVETCQQDRQKEDQKHYEIDYETNLKPNGFPIKQLSNLEINQLLEKELWPDYNSAYSSISHHLMIILMINEKFREKLPAWECIKKNPEEFSSFFDKIIKLSLSDELNLLERKAIVIFLIHCFNSLEEEIVRDELADLISIKCWSQLMPSRLAREFKECSKYENIYKKTLASVEKMGEEEKVKTEVRSKYFSELIKKFYSILSTISESSDEDLSYCERVIELLIDLESSLVTKRFLSVLFDDHGVGVMLSISIPYISTHQKFNLFRQLTEMFKFYHLFHVDRITGKDIAEIDYYKRHYASFETLQKICFKLFRDKMSDFYTSGIYELEVVDELRKHLNILSTDELIRLVDYLELKQKGSEIQSHDFFPNTREFLIALIVWKYHREEFVINRINEMALYPTEKMIWDENLIPTETFDGDSCLALPKLNLQFLTIHDYLIRNFHLFRYESTYEIRLDLQDCITRMSPIQNISGETVFTGWARMALPLVDFSINSVGQCLVGQNHPSKVIADVAIDVKMRQDFSLEWQSLRRGDPCFLICVRCTEFSGGNSDKNAQFAQRFGVQSVRGCEIIGLLNENGDIIDEILESTSKVKFSSTKRVYRVMLDPCQYQKDIDAMSNGAGLDVYASLNMIMRRKPKENNFKAVLETIRGLMNIECVVPEWMLSTLLGYESISSETMKISTEDKKVKDCGVGLRFFDTFLNVDHLKNSFPEYKIKFVVNQSPEQFDVTDVSLSFDENKKVINASLCCSSDNNFTRRENTLNGAPTIHRNSIPFTVSQVNAIKSAMKHGLTVIVGPPGTGKTDVAVQIISNLYHSFSNERTLIVTHSNQALNQIFEKIINLDIVERHCLRLGHGEAELETEKDFSRRGRVDHILSKRLQLLQQVSDIKASLNIPGDISFTCETASHFFLYQILPRWEKFKKYLSGLTVYPASNGTCSSSNDAEEASVSCFASETFPFRSYFMDLYRESKRDENCEFQLFLNQSPKDDLAQAEKYFDFIESVFRELEEYRPFEILRTASDRSKYLLIKIAKVIAMTCTHAALRRSDLVDLNFKYDNIIMEESAQILEIESFIPLLLQNPENGFSRLKRVILIGDHHQLPPVVKNMGFKRFSNFEQSLFARLVRVGFPYIELDAQGRSRESICSLFSWRYNKLNSLSHVLSLPQFTYANAGFLYDYQLINVEDLNGVGESEPTPYFYQNLAEAEFAVNLFVYMRLMGYPASSISIITSYNGQKHLIRDVLKQRTANNPLLGSPHKVTTIDRYQGQQNDYVIVSLVRTKAVGHIRDIRRLIVALSRARLGLYILARVNLFSSCYELSHPFSLLTARPTDLMIVPNEFHPTTRRNDHTELHASDVVTVMALHSLAEITKDMYMKRFEELQKQHEAEEEAKRIREEEAERLKQEEMEKELARKMQNGDSMFGSEIMNEITNINDDDL